MKLGTSTEILGRRFGEAEAVCMIARAGFDGVDWDFSGMEFDDNPWNAENWRDYAGRMRELVEKNGISVLQAHAPYPTSKGQEPYDSIVLERIVRSVEAASVLGAKRIVVHPMKHLNYVKHRAYLFEKNLELYRSLIPHCEKWGVQVCVENMYEKDRYTDAIVNSGCGMPEEFCAMLDELNSPWMVGCLDIGHAALVGVDPSDAIHMLGKDRLQALHVHDVDYFTDGHTLPFTEKLDWDSITAALAAIGYQGEFVFEADKFFRNFPDALCLDALRLMEKTGRYLMDEIRRKGSGAIHAL